MENISERIVELMEESGLSNTEFARKIEVNPSIISHIRSGRNKVSLQVIEQIAHAFTNVHIDYLISGRGALYGSITNVNPAKPAGFATGSAFPMEGIRHASIPGDIPPPPSDEVEQSVSAQEINEEKEPASKEGKEGKATGEIERIVIFYRDGTFKAYSPPI